MTFLLCRVTTHCCLPSRLTLSLELSQLLIWIQFCSLPPGYHGWGPAEGPWHSDILQLRASTRPLSEGCLLPSSAMTQTSSHSLQGMSIAYLLLRLWESGLKKKTKSLYNFRVKLMLMKSSAQTVPDAVSCLYNTTQGSFPIYPAMWLGQRVDQLTYFH